MASAESYTVGSHELSRLRRDTPDRLTLDTGHYRPTRPHRRQAQRRVRISPRSCLARAAVAASAGTAITSSSLVTTWMPSLQSWFAEDFLERTHIGLDCSFDASINRVAAWIVGARSVIRALLRAMLEPASQLRELERAGDFASRLVLQEAIEQLPFAAVWDHYCETAGVPSDQGSIGDVKRYERTVMAARR